MSAAITAFFASGSVETNIVRTLEITSRINHPFEARLLAIVPPDAALGDLLGAPAVVGFGVDGLGNVYEGVVVELSVLEEPGDSNDGLALEIVVASQMWLLGQSSSHAVFLDQDIKSIATAVCGDHGIGPERLDFRLSGVHEKSPIVAQYDETALAFLSRLCEAEGILWRSDASDDGEKIVFFDSSSSADACEGDGLRFIEGEGMADEIEVYFGISSVAKVRSGKVTLRDYDFTRPKLDIEGEAEASVDSELEIYEFADGFDDPSAGAARAKARLEAEQAQRKIVTIDGSSAVLTVGRIAALATAPASLDGSYFVTSVTQHIAITRGASIRTEAELCPKEVPYRAPFVTPRPMVSGIETATVVAPSGSDVETIHTDEHGRVKVKFAWDRSDRVADDASHWLRVMQLQTHDSLILPRVGWEVVVDYVEGDPTRGVVLGQVYNAANPPPYALPEGKTRTALQSASSPGGAGRNEIRMEDKAGSEEVAVTSQKDTTIAIAGDKTLDVVANKKRDVGASSSTTIGGNQTIQVNQGYEIGAATHVVSVGGSRTVSIDAVLGWAIGGASVTSIGGSQTEMISDPVKGLLSLAADVVAEAVQAEAQAALADLEGAVAGKVDQVLGPINDLQSQVGAASAAVGAVGGAGAAGDAMGQVAGLPSVGDVAHGMLGQGTSAIDGMIAGAVGSANAAAQSAIAGDGAGGGGSSEANQAGVDGSVPSNAAAAGSCGPGYSISKISGSSVESVSSCKIVLAAGKIATSITGARTTTVGAISAELVAGDRVETCLASKDEKSVGLAVLAHGGEVETVGGARATKVGGAVLEKISGGADVSSADSMKIAGAYVKIEASGSITFTCGESSVKIGDGGIEITAPLITLTSPSISLPQDAAEK